MRRTTQVKFISTRTKIKSVNEITVDVVDLVSGDSYSLLWDFRKNSIKELTKSEKSSETPEDSVED